MRRRVWQNNFVLNKERKVSVQMVLRNWIAKHSAALFDHKTINFVLWQLNKILKVDTLINTDVPLRSIFCFMEVVKSFVYFFKGLVILFWFHISSSGSNRGWARGNKNSVTTCIIATTLSRLRALVKVPYTHCVMCQLFMS